MIVEKINREINELPRRVPWFDSASGALRGWVRQTYQSMGPTGRKVENILHGTWLGHPLHPVLVDIPIGSWTAALLLDVLETNSKRKRRFAKAADAAVALGAAAAAGAAVAGVTDWQHTDGEARRSGFLHALLNTVALFLYTGSWFARRGKQRGLGKGLALVGYSTLIASAYIGGDLVFRQKIGVKHGPQPGGHGDFRIVTTEADLLEGQMKRVRYGDEPVLLARRGGNVYAMSDICSHLSGPLSEGRLDADSVTCPWHGSRYDLETGCVLDGPSTYPQARYDVRISGGMIEIRPGE